MAKRSDMYKKRNRYTTVRGGNSTLYDIYCRCQTHVLVYQKDGSGAILRLYIDRIIAPNNLAAYNTRDITKSTIPPLVCPTCQTRIGVPMIYAREQRLAFRVITGTCTKKKHISLKK